MFFYPILFIPLFSLLVCYLSIALIDRLDVRLVNGNSPYNSRVEVLHRGQWVTVCGEDWDMSDAAVVFVHD